MVEMLYSDQGLNRKIAHEGYVARVLDEVAAGVASRASGILAAHRHSGAAQITRTKGRLDRYVNLDDSRGQHAAAAIEYGHVAPNGRFVPGVHALTGALP